MAVRDEQPLKETRRGLAWRETLSHTPAVLLVGGLLIYGYLSICYNRFYGSLGVDPNDVGLSYTGTLARSSGFVILCLVIFASIPGFVLTIQMGNRRERRENPTAKTPRLVVVLSVLVTVALIVLVFRIPLLSAGYAARDVRAGRPVGPVQFLQHSWPSGSLLPIPVLAIHADPATVEPAGKPGDSPAAERLRGKKLLYLGQSGGTVVLYDADVQRAIYVSASSIVLQVTNCRAKPPPDTACQ